MRGGGYLINFKEYLLPVSQTATNFFFGKQIFFCRKEQKRACYFFALPDGVRKNIPSQQFRSTYYFSRKILVQYFFGSEEKTTGIFFCNSTNQTVFQKKNPPNLFAPLIFIQSFLDSLLPFPPDTVLAFSCTAPWTESFLRSFPSSMTCLMLESLLLKTTNCGRRS